MGKNAAEALGSKGRKDLHQLAPENLSIVYDSRHPLYRAEMFLPVDIDIATLPEQKHPLYDEEGAYLPLEEGTVRNIMVHGVLEPIAIRRNGERGDVPIVEVIYGRQRVKMAREANRRLLKEGKEEIRIGCEIKRGGDEVLFGMWISENAHRRETSPLASAKEIARYLDMGRSEEEAAVMWNMSVSAVKDRLALLDCAPPVIAAVESGTIGATLAARQFSKVPREEQGPMLEKLIDSGELRGVAAKEKVEKLRGVEPRKPAGERARPGKEIKKAIKALAKIERRDAEIACAALKWALGNDNVLCAFPAVEAAIYPETVE